MFICVYETRSTVSSNHFPLSDIFQFQIKLPNFPKDDHPPYRSLSDEATFGSRSNRSAHYSRYRRANLELTRREISVRDIIFREYNRGAARRVAAAAEPNRRQAGGKSANRRCSIDGFNPARVLYNLSFASGTGRPVCVNIRRIGKIHVSGHAHNARTPPPVNF